ncbi:MAG: DUF192 domain-containing protein [Methylomicrobium sp.]
MSRSRFVATALPAWVVLISVLASHSFADDTVELYAGIHRIEAEVANTDEARDVGLTFRPVLGANQGMIFVFPQVERHCMWMRDTLIPLSVAFMDEAGVIVSMDEMQPRSDTFHCALRPARYALEMNQGWFDKREFGAGSRISGLEKISRVR